MTVRKNATSGINSNVKRLKKFNEFLFESAKDIADKYLNGEIYPWDDKLIEVIGKIETSLEEINQMNERKPDKEDRIYLDIKIYDRPDFEEMSRESGNSIEWLQADYEHFLEDTLVYTIEDLEKSEWISEASVSGRSGGWLMVKFKKSILDDYVMQDEIDNDVNDYNIFKEDYEFNEDEIEQYKSSIGMQFSYDLGLAELPEGMEEAIELSNNAATNLEDSTLSDIDQIKKIVVDLKQRITNFKRDHVKSFSEGY